MAPAPSGEGPVTEPDSDKAPPADPPTGEIPAPAPELAPGKDNGNGNAANAA